MSLIYRKEKSESQLPLSPKRVFTAHRYSNIDYAFASTVSRELEAGIPHIVVTYDIACQWGKRLRKRLLAYMATKYLNVDSLQSFHLAVPKFHLIGHGKSCNLNYNLAFMQGVGMTHGESVEMIWSHSTSLATWSRENGPHAQHALLDTHWGGWNWRKLIHLCEYPSAFGISSTSLTFPSFTGQQLKKNLEKAWKFAKVQGNAAAALTDALDPTVVKSWTAMMDTYYCNPSRPNPFDEPAPSEFLVFHLLPCTECQSRYYS